MKAAVDVGSATLSNGVKLPLLGLGTWLAGKVNAEELEKQRVALRAALDAGYRYFDTASRYGNEALIGSVLQEYYDAGKLRREDVFLTTKLPFNGHSDPDYFLERSLRELRTDYIDLYLMHTPMPTKHDGNGGYVCGADGKFVLELIPLADTWRFFERKYRDGVLKSIGISNFSPKQIHDLCEKAEIPPQNLQVEMHIFHPQDDLVEACKRHNIRITSYGTLGSPGSFEFRNKTSGDCLRHPLVLELAEKYKKTPAQILLKHYVQRGISTIPKSVTPSRIVENIDIFDFEISADDQRRLAVDVKERRRLFNFDFLEHHPWYPFKPENW